MYKKMIKRVVIRDSNPRLVNHVKNMHHNTSFFEKKNSFILNNIECSMKKTCSLTSDVLPRVSLPT